MRKPISSIAITITAMALAGTGATTASAHGNAGLQGGALEVVLDEWTMGFREAKADDGKLSIHVVNKGRRRHDLVIRAKDGGRRYLKTPMIDTNVAAKFSLDLPPGAYEVYCSIPGHAGAGMRAMLTVGG